MPVKQDGTLHASTLKARRVPDSKRVDAPGAEARFIGTAGDLNGWDTPCRILEVTDSRGQQVNDAVDAGEVTIIIEPLVDDPEVGLQPTDVQLRVGYDEGYFLDIVGVVPPGLPTSEHTPGHRGLEHPTQEFMADIPAADQTGIQPGRGALQDLAGAGEHGDPLPIEEKELRADQAEWQRVYADHLNRHPEDVHGAIAAAEDATGLQPVVTGEEFSGPDSEPAQAPPTQEELEAAHARIFQAELEQTPDDPDRALAAANEATGLNVERITPQEPTRQDV
jgi:hypothetical protein